MKKRAATFGGMCAWRTTRFDLAQGSEVQWVDGLYASGDFFATLGCIECKMAVRAHRGSVDGVMAAHFEHLKVNPKCFRSDKR